MSGDVVQGLQDIKYVQPNHSISNALQEKDITKLGQSILKKIDASSDYSTDLCTLLILTIRDYKQLPKNEFRPQAIILLAIGAGFNDQRVHNLLKKIEQNESILKASEEDEVNELGAKILYKRSLGAIAPELSGTGNWIVIDGMEMWPKREYTISDYQAIIPKKFREILAPNTQVDQPSSEQQSSQVAKH